MSDAGLFTNATIRLLEVGGSEHHFDLTKTYHSTDQFYLDVLREATPQGSTLEVQLHPKLGSVQFERCELLIERPGLVISRRFPFGQATAASHPTHTSTLSKLELRYAGRRYADRDRLSSRSFTGIELQVGKRPGLLHSRSEELALTCFHESGKDLLMAERLLAGVQVQHSVTLFDLHFSTQTGPSSSAFSAPLWQLLPLVVGAPQLPRLFASSLVQCSPRKHIEALFSLGFADCTPQSSTYHAASAFAKTCSEHDLQATVHASPLALAKSRAKSKESGTGLVVNKQGNPITCWSNHLNGFVQLCDPANDSMYARLEVAFATLANLNCPQLVLHDFASLLLHSLGTAIGFGLRWARLQGLLKQLSESVKVVLVDVPLPLAQLADCSAVALAALPQRRAKGLQAKYARRGLSWHDLHAPSPFGKTGLVLDKLPTTLKEWSLLEAEVHGLVAES